MELSAAVVGSLRALDRWSTAADLGPGTPAEAASWSALWGGVAAGLSACRTPAWTERHVRILDRMIAKLGARPDVTAAAPALGTLLVLHGVRSMVLADHHRAGRSGAAGPGGYTVPQPDELAALAADLLRRSNPSMPSGTIPFGTSGGDAIVQGAVLGLGLWLHDCRFHTDWHAHSFQPWWSRTANLAGAAAGARAAVLAWLLTPQAPGAAEPLLDRMPVDATPSDTTTVTAWSHRSTLALQLLVAGEWSLERAGALRDQLDATRSRSATNAVPEERGRGSGDWVVEAQVAAAHAGTPGCWAALCRGPVATAAQVIDVDFPTLALTRAEWSNGFLHVGLDVEAPEVEAPGSSRRTTFRIVGAEPRVWWASGLPNITTEMSATSVSITVPLMSGTIEFAPSSY